MGADGRRGWTGDLPCSVCVLQERHRLGQLSEFEELLVCPRARQCAGFAFAFDSCFLCMCVTAEVLSPCACVASKTRGRLGQGAGRSVEAGEPPVFVRASCIQLTNCWDVDCRQRCACLVDGRVLSCAAAVAACNWWTGDRGACLRIRCSACVLRQDVSTGCVLQRRHGTACGLCVTTKTWHLSWLCDAPVRDGWLQPPITHLSS